jgi:hypothetical protein
MTNETGQTRRIVLGGLAASAGLLSMIDETTAQAQATGKTFVLVHGAWRLVLAAGVGRSRREVFVEVSRWRRPNGFAAARDGGRPRPGAPVRLTPRFAVRVR